MTPWRCLSGRIRAFNLLAMRYCGRPYARPFTAGGLNSEQSNPHVLLRPFPVE